MQNETKDYTGVWIVGEILTLKIGNRVVNYTLATTVIDNELALFLIAINAANIKELSSITVTHIGGQAKLQFISTIAGEPFVVLMSTNSAAGVIATTVLLASTGSNHIDEPQNWRDSSTGLSGLPGAPDTAVLRDSNVDILYGLDTTITCTDYIREASYTGRIGLLTSNVLSGVQYDEYRQRFLKISASGVVQLGKGAGKNSERCNIQFTSLVDCTIYSTGRVQDKSTHAVEIITSVADNIFSFQAGDIGLATSKGTAVKVKTLDVSSGATVHLGDGITWAVSPNVTNRGRIFSNVAFKVLNNYAGSVRVLEGAVAVSGVYTVFGGEILTHESGTLASFVVYGGATFSRENTADLITITDAIMYPGSTYIARNYVHTNDIVIKGGSLQDVTINTDASNQLKFTVFDS